MNRSPRADSEAVGSGPQQSRRTWSAIASIGVCQRSGRFLQEEIRLPVECVVDESGFRAAGLLSQALQSLQALANRIEFRKSQARAGMPRGGRRKIPVAVRLSIAINGRRWEQLRLQFGQCLVDQGELDDGQGK